MIGLDRVSERCASDYLGLLRQLDRETEFMIYEPGERKANLRDIAGHLQSVNAKKNQVVFGYWAGSGLVRDPGRPGEQETAEVEQLVGYLSLFGGKQRRLSCTASLSVGVLKHWQGFGIASRLWDWSKKWAEDAGIHMIELSVMMCNIKAIELYEKWGFRGCGLYKDRLKVAGRWMDEAMMQFQVGGWEE